MTKRFLALAVVAAAAFSPLLASPAQADHCISWFTTPVACAEDVEQDIRDKCPIEGTYPSCLRK